MVLNTLVCNHLTPLSLKGLKFWLVLQSVWFEGLMIFWSSKSIYLLCDGSMGVGRTGVFIALSIALERMRYEGVVDMFQTVRLLRTQRPAMVQTEVGLIL